MGASGSGKTSLLNILGQRLSVSKGSKMTGSIKSNSIEVEKGDFGKIDAFVMQDDILIETMTPFESFCFAGKLPRERKPRVVVYFLLCWQTPS